MSESSRPDVGSFQEQEAGFVHNRSCEFDSTQGPYRQPPAGSSRTFVSPQRSSAISTRIRRSRSRFTRPGSRNASPNKPPPPPRHSKARSTLSSTESHRILAVAEKCGAVQAGPALPLSCASHPAPLARWFPQSVDGVRRCSRRGCLACPVWSDDAVYLAALHGSGSCRKRRRSLQSVARALDIEESNGLSAVQSCARFAHTHDLNSGSTVLGSQHMLYSSTGKE